MRRTTMRKALAGFAGVGLAAASVVVAHSAIAESSPSTAPSEAVEYLPSDDLPFPLEEKRRAAREAAVAGVLTGEYQTEQRGASTVVNLGADSAASTRVPGHNPRTQYVELARETTDRIFVILAEFGDERHPSFLDVDTNASIPGPARFDGPRVNEIPQPDRSVDNSTVWRPDFSQEYFQELYFGGGESLKNYYEAQSSGRYSVEGVVTDWVRVQFNQARYGRSDGFPCASNVCNNTWLLVRDAANQWVADQLAAGRTLAEVQTELAEFDVWDRYDWDGDGDFNEPDGFIDHFQIVHSGGDQADGDPIYGEDAIWSHRWYAAVTNGPHPGLPGTQIGTTGFWIGDYTIQPENGGRSVFYHEFAHDLGLPDDYNNQRGGDNNNEHWTLMAQSRLGAATDEGIGERGGDLGAWNKLQKGWLDAEVVNYDQHKVVQLGPQEYNSQLPQGIVVVLPDKPVLFDRGAPFAGQFQWYSGHRDGVNWTISRTVTVPTSDPTLRYQTRYDIETGFDVGYVQVNDDVVSAWDGTSTSWVARSIDLSAYAGQTVELTFGYQTDGGVGGNNASAPDGVFLDDISLGTFTDGAENGTGDWTVDGWVITGQQQAIDFDQFYIAGWRTYTSYDQYLKTGPYYFGYGTVLPDKVDHYAYQQGLLISYWDTSFSNNDTMVHPGQGRNLYIDAHPQPFARANGELWRARIQVYDAPFGLQTTDRVSLHHNGALETFGGLPANSTFRDTDKYFYDELPNHGVKLPAVGVTIRVLSTAGGKMQVKVN